MAPDSHAGRVGTGARRPPLFPELVLVAGEAPRKGLHAWAVGRLLPKVMFLRGPISMVKMMAEGRSDCFHVPSYLGGNAHTGRHEASALTRERRPSAAPPHSQLGTLCQVPEPAPRWHRAQVAPVPPRGAPALARLSHSQTVRALNRPGPQVGLRQPASSQGPRSARSCWPPAWGPG